LASPTTKREEEREEGERRETRSLPSPAHKDRQENGVFQREKGRKKELEREKKSL